MGRAERYAFPNGGRMIIHGGMVSTLLDTAMGHACLASLGGDEMFLTADLHVDFYRAATPGLLRAVGEVVHQSRRAMFCGASLYDADGDAARVGPLHADRPAEAVHVKAIVIAETGGPERLALQDVPEPDLSEGQSLVHVRAAGVNFLDLLIRKGDYPQAPALPTILGVRGGRRDGGRPSRHRPAHGRRLCGAGGGRRGSGSSRCRRTRRSPRARRFCSRTSRPGSRSPARCASSRARPCSSTRAPAASAAARSRSRATSARASSPLPRREEKRRYAVEAGAERRTATTSSPSTSSRTSSSIPVGGEVFAASVKALAPLGTIVGIGYAGGWWEELNPALLVGRNIGVQGFYLGRLMAPPARHRPARRPASCSSSGPRARCSPLVGAEFPLAEAADAHRLIEDRKHVGKVVLDV